VKRRLTPHGCALLGGGGQISRREDAPGHDRLALHLGAFGDQMGGDGVEAGMSSEKTKRRRRVAHPLLG
jgi:hypothetical protein